MFRRQIARRVPRYSLGAAAAGGLSLYSTEPSSSQSSPQEAKSSIYAPPAKEIVLVEDPNVLEQHIGDVRRAMVKQYLETYSHVQGVVDRWIQVEHAVEARIKALIAPSERLTPALLYVGVAFLSGSIVARNRSILNRFFLPPTLALITLNYALPKTSSNIYEYCKDLEPPRMREIHDTASAHSRMTWDMAVEKVTDWNEQAQGVIAAGVEKTQQASGLKIREALGWTQSPMSSITEKQKEKEEKKEEEKAGGK